MTTRIVNNFTTLTSCNALTSWFVMTAWIMMSFWQPHGCAPLTACEFAHGFCVLRNLLQFALKLVGVNSYAQDYRAPGKPISWSWCFRWIFGSIKWSNSSSVLVLLFSFHGHPILKLALKCRELSRRAMSHDRSFSPRTSFFLPFATFVFFGILRFFRIIYQWLHITFRLPVRINSKFFIFTLILRNNFKLQLLCFSLFLNFSIRCWNHFNWPLFLGVFSVDIDVTGVIYFDFANGRIVFCAFSLGKDGGF